MRHPLSILVLLAVAVAISLTSRVACAEGGSPPPPGIDDAEIAIPKAIIRAYESQVHPAYLRWLANGDGIADSLAAFELFLGMQPVSRHEAWCYMVLYTRSH
jgi:hypothetical protein